MPTMRSWLRAGDPWLRWTLVRSLRFVKVTARSLQLLRSLYEKGSPEIRRRVVSALLELHDPESDQSKALCEVIRRSRQDPSKRVRELILEGEERFGVDFDAPPPEVDEMGEVIDTTSEERKKLKEKKQEKPGKGK